MDKHGRARTDTDTMLDESDPMAGPRGCMWALVLSVPVWIAIGVAVWLWTKWT